jgi:hypothetical protein
MPQYRISRKVKTLNVVAGGFDTADLPRSYDYESIFLRISGVLNVTTGCTSVRAEAPCQLVPRVIVIADGKNNIFNAPFWATSLARIDRELASSGARATTPPTAATVAAYTVEAIGVIDLATVDGMRPKDSNFRTSALSLFQIQCQFGAAIDSFVPGAGVVSFTGTPTVEIFTRELVELPDDKNQFTNPIMLRKVSSQEMAVAASNPSAEIRLPAGNLLKSVLFRGEGSVTAGEPSSGVINAVQLASGIDVRVNLTGPQLRAQNNADFGQITTGYYITDVTKVGPAPIRLQDLWDLTGQTEPKAILDVTGAANNKVQAIITEYIPAR